jgi:hypothetical protein
MWQQIAARLPQGSGQPFTLSITEYELSRLAFEEVASNVEVDYKRLSVKILPDRIVVSTFADFVATFADFYAAGVGWAKYAQAGVRLECTAEGVPIVVENQVRFRVDRLEVDNTIRDLEPLIQQCVVNTLNKSLWFLWPTQEARIRSAHFRVERVQLAEGMLQIEGLTD